MFGAGFEGEDLPPEERWRALQWLGERTAQDPRFATAMVEHVYYLLTGRKVLLPPKDLDDPLYAAKRRAYQAQREQIEAIAARFAQTGFNFKSVFKDWVVSDFYRADGLATAAANPQRHAELDDIGLVRMLAPEQVERKVAAIFGKPWGKLHHADDKLRSALRRHRFQGSHRARRRPERRDGRDPAHPGQRRGVQTNARCDFSRPPAERLLFPGIEPDVVPGTSPDADAKIRRAIVHLHRARAGPLRRAGFAGGRTHLRALRRHRHRRRASARASNRARTTTAAASSRRTTLPDPQYTVRAWRGVVTYLLRQREFLYE